MNGNKINAVFYAESYHPIQAGSIDGTDILPHDNAIYRAHLCASAGLYDPFGDPKVIGDPYCTVFVGRLSRHTSEDTLHEAMSEYGRVKNLRLVRHIVTGASRGYAFVEYETEREMRSAYKDAHHTMIDDCKIIVDYYRQQLMPGWIPRRLGGGLGGEKESGQLRFGGREKPFRAPLKPIPFDDLKRLGIPPPPEGRYMSRFQDPSPPRRERNSVDREGSQKRDVQDRTHKRSFVDGEDRYHKRSSLEQEDHSHKWSSVERDERYSERTSMDRYHKRSSLDQDEHSHKWSSVEREEHYSERTSVDRDDRSHNMSSSRREERHHKRSSSSRSHKRSSKDRDERTHKSHKHSDHSPRHERRSTSCDLSSDLSKDSNEAGLGVVIQYDKGEVMVALAEKILLPTSVELLESLAARRAVLFTVELGFNQAIEKILLLTSVELLESFAARRAVLFTVELGFNQAIEKILLPTSVELLESLAA